jgi:hypothetical protein
MDAPKSKIGAFGDAFKIIVGRQHRQVMPDTQLGEKGVNRSDLNPAAAALVPQGCSFDVITAIRHQQRDSRKPADDLIAGLGAGEPCRSSWRTKPVVTSVSSFLMASTRTATSIASGK